MLKSTVGKMQKEVKRKSLGKVDEFVKWSGKYHIPQSWYPSDIEWKAHHSNCFETTTITSGPLYDFIASKFQNNQSYTISKVKFIRNKSLQDKFDTKVESLEFFREEKELPDPKIPQDWQKEEILQKLKNLFDEHKLENNLNRANILLMWHGCSPANWRSLCKFGLKDLRYTDGGFFGSGIYLTSYYEYALKYSTFSNPNSKQEFTVLLCLAVVGLTYPVSRKTDYAFPDDLGNSWDISNFHYCHPFPTQVIEEARKGNLEPLKTYKLQKGKRYDKALQPGFDSHYVCVSTGHKYQAVIAAHADCDELVVKEEAQTLPVAVVHFRKK